MGMADLLTEAELRALLLAPKRVESRDKVVENQDPEKLLDVIERIEARGSTSRRLYRRVLLSPPGTQ